MTTIIKSIEFASMADWAEWYSHNMIQQVLLDMHTLAINVSTELWRPSPMMPEPVRPSG
ncbi:MAG: hypothetical protein H6658_05585 [Ardenticatenaceae bacterium]|nr:hypothetical protein [Ardenticatenaceae bacterium]